MRAGRADRPRRSRSSRRALSRAGFRAGATSPHSRATDQIPGEPGTPPPGRGRAPAIDIDGGFVIDRSDPPPPAGDLREDVTRFTTLDACVAQHAVIDPLVGDAVRSIGYDTLLRDACRILEAIKKKDPTPCSLITASALERQECRIARPRSLLQDPRPVPAGSSRPTEAAQARGDVFLAVATRAMARVRRGAGGGGAGLARRSRERRRIAVREEASATERPACLRDVSGTERSSPRCTTRTKRPRPKHTSRFMLRTRARTARLAEAGRAGRETFP